MRKYKIKNAKGWANKDMEGEREGRDKERYGGRKGGAGQI